MEHEQIKENSRYYTTQDKESEEIVPANSEVIVEKKARNGDVNIQVKVIANDFRFWMTSEYLTDTKPTQTVSEDIIEKKEF